MRGGSQPTAAQKRLWNELTDLGCCVCGSPWAEIHHPLGSTFRYNKQHIGNDFVLSLCAECHRLNQVNMTSNRKKFCDGLRKSWGTKHFTDLDCEKRLFKNQLKRYQFQLEKDYPITEEIKQAIREARR